MASQVGSRIFVSVYRTHTNEVLQVSTLETSGGGSRTGLLVLTFRHVLSAVASTFRIVSLRRISVHTNGYRVVVSPDVDTPTPKLSSSYAGTPRRWSSSAASPSTLQRASSVVHRYNQDTRRSRSCDSCQQGPVSMRQLPCSDGLALTVPWTRICSSSASRRIASAACSLLSDVMISNTSDVKRVSPFEAAPVRQPQREWSSQHPTARSTHQPPTRLNL